MRQARGITIEFPGLRKQFEGTIFYCYVTGDYEKGWILSFSGAVVPTLRAAINAWMERLTSSQKLLAVAGGIVIKEHLYNHGRRAKFAVAGEYLHHFSFPYPEGGV